MEKNKTVLGLFFILSALVCVSSYASNIQQDTTAFDNRNLLISELSESRGQVKLVATYWNSSVLQIQSGSSLSVSTVNLDPNSCLVPYNWVNSRFENARNLPLLLILSEGEFDAFMRLDICSQYLQRKYNFERVGGYFLIRFNQDFIVND
jgi:hypothetical protein